jgi:hypothetical protein
VRHSWDQFHVDLLAIYRSCIISLKVTHGLSSLCAVERDTAIFSAVPGPFVAVLPSPLASPVFFRMEILLERCKPHKANPILRVALAALCEMAGCFDPPAVRPARTP